MSPMPDNVFDYGESVWSRFHQAAHAGRITGPGNLVRAEAGSVAARSLLRIQVLPGPPLQARFQAYGCPTAIAVGEWLCEQLEVQGKMAMFRYRAPEIRAALEIPEERIHCALMGEDVLWDVLRQL